MTLSYVGNKFLSIEENVFRSFVPVSAFLASDVVDALLDFLAASEISYYLVWYSLLISQVCCPDAPAPAPARATARSTTSKEGKSSIFSTD